MLADWFDHIELPITIEQFHRLPQNPAYKYEYFGKRALLSPRPKMYHALLDLASFAAPIEMGPGQRRDKSVSVRPLAEEDWVELPKVFGGAFHRVQPFAGLTDEKRRKAARDCLKRTRNGEEGPLIAPACWVATFDADQRLVGALLTTLMPRDDLSDYRAGVWKKPPPPDAIKKKLGRPHLTWIFVGHWHAGEGVGTALLAAAVRGLRKLGYKELASSFLLGNETSTLWHWRMGFRLLPFPGSMRLIRETIAKERSERS